MKKNSRKLHAGLLALLLMLGVFGKGAVTAYAEDTVTDVAVEDVTDGEVADGEVTQEGVTEDVPEPEAPKFVYEMELFENEARGDMALYMEYEGALPEITFLSPSGKEYSEFVSTEEEFLYLHSEDGGWSNFQIVNAEAGMWSVRIVKADEEKVLFRKMQVEEGVVIQEFTLRALEGKEATVYFDVTKGDTEYYYHYTIDMVSADGQMIKRDLVSGDGMTGTPQEITIYMDASSCGNAHLVLNVECDDNAGTYDIARTEEFAYDNPDTPAALSGLTITLDENDLKCTVDWSQYQPWGWGLVAYNVKAYADIDTEGPIYDDSGLTTTNTYFYYPRDTKELEIVVTYTLDGILSGEYVKKVDLSSNDYIRIPDEDVTTKVMLPLEYSAKEAAQLTVSINGQTGVYRIKGQDTIFFTLEEGNNEFYATFTGADGITYVIEKDIYLGIVVPRITLFEELDGTVFHTTTAKVSGKVENAAVFTVNGVDVVLSEDGSFVYDVPLEPGENEVILNAMSESGEGATMVLTITRDGDEVVSDEPVITPTPGEGTDGDGTDGDGTDGDVPVSTTPTKKAGFDWKKYLPLILAGGLFVVLLVIFFVVLRNKKNKKKFTGKVFVVIPILLLIASGVVTGLAIYMHHRLRDFNNSLEYIELARQSLEKAANYLAYETEAKELATTFGYITIGIAFLIPIVILVRRKVVYGAFFKKKDGLAKKDAAAKDKEQKATEDVAEEIAEEIALEEVAEEETPETEGAEAEDTAAATKEE